MKKNVLIGSAAALVLGGLVYTLLVLTTEGCPDVELQADFNALRYTGLWYEHGRDRSIRFEKGDCQQARYGTEEIESKGRLSVVNS